MDGVRFDNLAKALASGVTRRRLLGRLAGGTLGGALATVGLGGTVLGACARGEVRCHDGSCADLRTDPTNCGRCGTQCDGGLCYAGRCLSACPSGFAAHNGTCVRTCPAGMAACDGVCTSLNTHDNCGRCGNVCTSGLCYAGECVNACPSGLAAHNGTCVQTCPAGMAACDGVCTPLNTFDNCGACGMACVGGGICCPDANGTFRCVSRSSPDHCGSCEPCPAGQDCCNEVCSSTPC